MDGLISRIRKVPGDKIHFFEISDCCRPSKTAPLFRGSLYDDYHRAKEGFGQQVAFTWHMCARCLPYVGANAGADAQRGGFGDAHVVEIAKAVFETGFNGETVVLIGRWYGWSGSSDFLPRQCYILGPISFEVFEAQYMDTQDPTVPERYARAGQVVKDRLYGDLLS